MDNLNVRITRILGNAEHTIEVNLDGLAKAPEIINIVPAAPRPAERAVASAAAAPQQCRFVRVAIDGSRLADGDTTAHVAVIDTTTGLMWSIESLGDPADEDNGITQEHCIERCRLLRLLGHDDWRLPTRSELAALVDETRHEPAIDASAFPRVKSRWHWTSTPAAWSSASAWLVYFGDGGVGYDHRGYDGFALACRPAGQ